jgi:flagellar hook-associated protein 2
MRREVLKSDTSALGTMESQMRAVLNSRVEGLGSLTNAFEAGLSTQKNGSLSVDTAMLSKIVAEDFDGLAKLFADPAQGLAKRLYDLADSYLETGGVLDGRSVGLERQVRESENKKTSVQERLKIVEARLLKTYNNLDLVVNRLQGTNSALTSQLEAITGFYRINNR